MDPDAIFKDDARVPFNGPWANLALLFEPTSFVSTYGEEAWPRATIAFRTQGVRATMKSTFFPGSLSSFVRELDAAHRALKGTVNLESEDGDFRLTVTFGDRGDAVLTGHLQPDVLNETKLVFEIATDQSYLNYSLASLRLLGI